MTLQENAYPSCSNEGGKLKIYRVRIITEREEFLAAYQKYINEQADLRKKEQDFSKRLMVIKMTQNANKIMLQEAFHVF